MKSIKCPKCSRWIWYDERTEVDFIHQCEDSNGNRLQSRDEDDHQFSRITLRIDADEWSQFGINPKMPKKSITESQWKKIKKDLLDIDTYIKLV